MAEPAEREEVVDMGEDVIQFVMPTTQQFNDT